MQIVLVGFSQTKQNHYYKSFHVKNINLESRLLKKIISRFEINVNILLYTM